MTIEEPNQSRIDRQHQELKISPASLNIDQQSINTIKKEGIQISPLSPKTIAHSEEDEVDEKANESYCILSKNRIIFLLIIVVCGAMLSSLSATIYFPSLNNVQQDLHINAQQANLTMTVFLISQGLSPAFWGSLADLWGRRPVYLMTMIINCLACIGLALVERYDLLLFLRIMQAFGSSSLLAVGAGLIGDIAEPSKRAGYYGIYSMGHFLGPVIGPIVGGLTGGTIGWKWNFWILLIMTATVLIIVFLFVPETLRSLVGNGSGYANPTPSQWTKRRRQQFNNTTATATKSRFLQCPDFLAPFTYLLQVDVFVCLTFFGIFFGCYFCYVVAAPSLLRGQYGLNTIQIGLCFGPTGMGCITGSFVSGKVLDKSYLRMLRRYQHDHPGVLVDRACIPLDFPIYHVRLRTAWPFLILGQCVTLGYGWIVQYKVSLAVPLIFQFIIGFCMLSLMTSTQTLIVDLFPGRGASITASNNLVRCILAAIAAACVEPGIQGVGVGWFFTIVGIIIMLSNGLYIYLLNIGNKYRIRRHGEETSTKALEP